MVIKYTFLTNNIILPITIKRTLPTYISLQFNATIKIVSNLIQSKL